jgi:hypothetical protein
VGFNLPRPGCPGRHADELERARDEGLPHVILDGKIIEADRCREKTISVKGEVTGLWYSGKAHAHGGGVQAIFTPGGFPLWVSDAEPGPVHDITAARRHALPGLPRPACRPLLIPGYDGAGIGVHIPVRQPADGREPGIGTRTRNAALAALPRRTRVRPAHRPLARPAAHHRQPIENRQHPPRRPRSHPFRVPLHHMNR